MEEKYFKNIENFETFSFSNMGNVKDNRTGKLMSQYPDELTGGYFQVNLKNPSGYSTKLL